MGYTSSVQGLIEFDPPINWAQYQDAGRFRADGDNWLRLLLTTESVETNEGTLERKFARAIVSRCDQHGRLKNAETGVAEDLRDLMISLDRLDPERTYSGELIREGERQGDVQRFWISNDTGAVMTARTTLQWGDPEVLS